MKQKTKQRALELKQKYGNELVYAVPYFLTEDIDDKLTICDEKKYSNLFLNGKYFLRCDVEEDISLQQIIPYAYIKCNDLYYITKRLKGDVRLKDKLSIGIGGHINECDGYENNILKGLARELNEEVNITSNYKLTHIGVIRDLTSQTADHIGIVYEIEINKCDKDSVSVKEVENLSGCWMTKQELIRDYFKFEGWAKYIINYIATNK